MNSGLLEEQPGFLTHHSSPWITFQDISHLCLKEY
ncbi:rCG29997 [Rattus norvegicus]|uniref:RCG29997 n=1 Tax=Rattus norvegicus TaxID=10116 RepID=A6ILZ5_RAT|nr:rCG29997 [Rattus norvegicus]